MLLSVMDGAELDMNKTLLSAAAAPPPPSSSSSLTSTSDDFEKDLQLAAELGRCLLERNQELQNYISVLQKQIDEEQADIKLLHVKLESTREQLETKCKQTEILDANNFDLERELAEQRRENERQQQRIKELTDLYEKTRKQCYDIEQEFERFRLRQFSTQFFPKLSKISAPSTTSNIQQRMTRHQRSHSFDGNCHIVVPSPSICSHSFDLSSNFKTYLIEFKSRLHALTLDCSMLNEKLQQSEEEKSLLIDRLTQVERIHRDECDSFQNELNSYRKLIENRSSTFYSPIEHDLSLYDEVLLESQPTSQYQTTNYKDLFARVYQKLNINSSRTA